MCQYPFENEDFGNGGKFIKLAPKRFKQITGLLGLFEFLIRKKLFN